MKKAQKQVAEFMRNAGQSVAKTPRIPSDVQLALGVQLILEEAKELHQATHTERDLVKIFDALCDIIYVSLWLGNAAGLPIEKGFEEVHSSNLSKFIDGHRDEETGKWMKGKSYTPPRLAEIIATAIGVEEKAVAEEPYLPGIVE